MINSILDVYHSEPLDVPAVKAAGIVAIIHKATQGLEFTDPEYHERRDAAKSIGLLWGSYHFSSGDDPKKQAEHYLHFAQPADDEAICLDFEPSSRGPDMSAGGASIFVSTVRKLTGRWPLIYGGHLIREQFGHHPNSILSKCPLWYAQYHPAPSQWPQQIWPDWMLWQYTDGSNGNEPHITAGRGYDRNIFHGTEAELRAGWPFTNRTVESREPRVEQDKPLNPQPTAPA